MAYSFTEKKRIRKDFGKRPSILDVPFLLATQIDSYREFLQEDAPAARRLDAGLHAAFKSVFPIESYSGYAVLEYVSYRLGEPRLRRARVPAARRDLCRPPARAAAPGDLRQGGPGRHQGRQGHQGAGGLHGRIAAHDRDRHLHHQRDRARHRLPVAPLPGRLLRPRQGQDPLLGQAPVLGACDPLPRVLAGLRVRSQGQRLRAHRPAPQAAGDHPAARPGLLRSSRSSSASSRPIPSASVGEGIELDLVPERLRGETVGFDVKIGDEVVVEAGRRVTARHIRELQKAGVERLEVPPEFVDRAASWPMPRSTPGPARSSPRPTTLITAELLANLLVAKGIEQVETLFVNDLDQGPYISETLRIDPTTSDLEAHGGDLPHDAPRRAAHQGRGPEPVPQPVLHPGPLRPVRGRAHEVQPPPGPARPRSGPGVLYDGRYFSGRTDEFSKRLRETRARPRTSSTRSRCWWSCATAAARWTTSTTWATGASAASARWRRTSSASVWCGSSAPSRSACPWRSPRA